MCTCQQEKPAAQHATHMQSVYGTNREQAVCQRRQRRSGSKQVKQSQGEYQQEAD